MTVEQRFRAIRLSEWVKEDPKTARNLGISVKQTISAARDEGQGFTRRKEGATRE